MSERGKRVFRFLLDPERDADVIGRMEAQPSMTGYVRELVRRDIYDELLDFAALKASELQAENAKLRELAERAWKTAERMCQAFDGPCRDDGVTIYTPCPLGERDEECVYGLLQRDLRELGIEVDE